MHRFNIFSRYCLTIVCAIALSISSQSAFGQKDDAPKFNIGSKAPDIDVEHWVSDNEGAFQHVKELEKDKVYVIEFWATWCPPCIAAMPHIAELQEKYESKGVQVISISDEDIDTVETFLERPVRGQDEDADPKQTYGDLTNSYCLTADPDKSVMKDYFVAAGRTGIPCAFIVGKTGIVEWIGHPMQIDKPLEAVVYGKWDRDEFKAEYEESEKKRLDATKKRRVMQQKLNKTMRSIQEKMQDGEEDEAIKLLDELIKDKDVEPAKQQLMSMRLQMMISIDHDDAPEALATFVKENKENSQALNEVAWGIYELYESNGGDVSPKILKEARQAAEFASKVEPESGAILDTLAHFIYIVDEDLDKAIEVQKKAVKNAGPQLQEIKPFLDQLLKEKETGKKPSKKKKKKDISDF